MRLTARGALREWWLQIARLGMTPGEMIESLLATLDDAGYKIVRKSEKS